MGKNYDRILCITYCHNHAHSSANDSPEGQSKLLERQSSTALVSIPNLPSPSSVVLLFCWLPDAALMTAVILGGMSALSDTFPLLPAPEVVESHERPSCGASAYSMGKYLLLSYSSTFAACHEWFNNGIFSLSSVEFPQYSPTHWHYIVGINPVSCALKFSWVMGRTRWLVSFPTLSYLHAHWSLLFCCSEWAVTPLAILCRALKPEILPLAPHPSSEMTDTGLAAQFSNRSWESFM